MSRIHEALLKAQNQQGLENHVFDLENRPLSGPAPADGILAASSEPTLSGSPVETANAIAQSFREYSWEPDKARLVFMKAGLSIGIEEFRTLRSNLFRERSQRHLKTILITGANPGEGKTFVAANLALAMSRHPGSRVLLIDADLRRPGLHSVFGMERTPGLSDYLSGVVDDAAIVRQTPEPQLCVVTSGRDSGTPTELLHSRRMQHFIDRMSPSFNWIFIDSPPAASISDSAVLSEICDGVIMVIAPGAQVHVAQQARKQIGLKILGVVLNRVDYTSTYYKYYYYYTARLNTPIRDPEDR